jgi:hypothetical protein
MLKNISNINGAQELSNKEQKSVKGGFNFPPFPGNDCCVCTFFPAGSPYLVLITQPCDIPCPEDGSFGSQGTGC